MPGLLSPDDPAALRASKDGLLLEVWRACNKSGHELLLEVILPENGPKTSAITTMLEHFCQLGDQTGLEEAAAALQRQLAADHRPHRARRSVEPRDPDPRDRRAFRQTARQFRRGGRTPMIKGFAVGRTIFWPAVAALDAR